MILANKKTIMVLYSFPESTSKLRTIVFDSSSRLTWFCALFTKKLGIISVASVLLGKEL